MVTTDERAAKVDAFKGFLALLIALVLGVEVGNLANVVANDRKEQELERTMKNIEQ